MRSSWTEPYLWVHLAGIAAVPIFLELCLLGLAATESFLPVSLLLVAAAGIAPIFWMQWQRPFSIFSLTPLVLQPSQLSESQRRILQRFKAPVGKVIAVVMAIGALVILWQLNRWVPLVSPVAKIVPAGGLGGLLLASVAFLLSNLFLQVPASVLAVLLTPDAQLAATEPYPVTQISKDFSLIGFPVKQILPPVITTPPVAPAVEAVEAAPAIKADPLLESPPVSLEVQAEQEVLPEAPVEESQEDKWIESNETVTAEAPNQNATVAPKAEDTIVEIKSGNEAAISSSEAAIEQANELEIIPEPNVENTIVTIGLPISDIDPLLENGQPNNSDLEEDSETQNSF